MSPYGPVLADRDVRTILVLGTFVRIPIFASWVVISLHVVSTLGHGYGAAGLAAALAAAGASLGAPWRGRAIDRIGLRRALVPSIVMTILCWSIAPWISFTPFLVVAAVAGVFLLPAFAVLRMALLAAVAEDQRRSALSLDSVLTEISFMVGPLAGAWAATTWDTRWVLLTVEACVALGGVLMWLVNPAVASDGSPGMGAPTRRTWIRPRFLAICAGAVASVAVLQGTDLALIAELRGMDAVAMIGPALAVWGLGSLVGGLVYGVIPRSVPLWLLLAGLCAVTAPMALATGPWTLTALAFVAGVLCAPTLTATVDEISRIVPAGALGEAMGWHSSSLTMGEVLGAPLAGWAIDRWNAGAGFWSVALAGLAVALVVAAVQRRPPAKVTSPPM